MAVLSKEIKRGCENPLGIKFESSGKAASTLNYRAVCLSSPSGQ